MNVPADEWNTPDVAGSASAEDPPPQLVYPTVQAWVEQWLSPMYRRDVDGGSATWCPSWWQHPEALVRLEALWRSWEHLRLDPATGMSVWMRDHHDHHMAVLTSVDGPFKGCHNGHRTGARPLKLQSPPPGWF